MPALDIAAIERAAVATEPFAHLLVPGAVQPDALAAIHRDFPAIDRPGSFPAWTVSCGPALSALLTELQGAAFSELVGNKFAIDLRDRPTMVTVRGRCRASDGQIHTDSAGKLVTVLLYLNPAWQAPGGQLRLLRSAADIDDYAVEVPPAEGTLVAFRCAGNAWHGHQPFDGERRAIQLNWVTGLGYLLREQARHGVSALSKRLGAT